MYLKRVNLDYPKETTIAIEGRPGNQKSTLNNETSHMRLGSNTNSNDNDSDAYAASQGSIDTDQASEMGEGGASDGAISSENIIGENNNVMAT